MARLGRIVVLLALVAGAGHSQDDPPSPPTWPELMARHEAALAAEDWPASRTTAEALRESAQDMLATSLYEIARAEARLGHGEDALSALERAREAGFFNAMEVRRDPAFASLTEDERFRTLVRRIWADAYIAMLERPDREAFQMPDRVMEALAFRSGERVADVGAGSGYFTVRVAAAVGPTGTVWAIDAVQEMLDHLAARLEGSELANVVLKKVGRDDPELPPGGVDTVLMVDVYHYIQDKPAYALKLRDGLAPGGRVVVIDYRPKPWEERPWGPPPEQQFPRSELDAAMAAAGLVPLKVHDFLPEQFFVEYGRPASP